MCASSIPGVLHWCKNYLFSFASKHIYLWGETQKKAVKKTRSMETVEGDCTRHQTR